MYLVYDRLGVNYDWKHSHKDPDGFKLLDFGVVWDASSIKNSVTNIYFLLNKLIVLWNLAV